MLFNINERVENDIEIVYKNERYKILSTFVITGLTLCDLVSAGVDFKETSLRPNACPITRDQEA